MGIRWEMNRRMSDGGGAWRVRWGRSMESQMRKEHGESDGRGTGGGQTEEEYGGSYGEEHGGPDGVRTEEVRWRRNMGIRWGRNIRRSDGGGTWGSDRGGAWGGSDMSAFLAYLGLQKLASPRVGRPSVCLCSPCSL